MLVHGFSGSSQVWGGFIPLLTEKYRLIVPDLRGHGHSTGAPESIHHNRFADDLVALLDCLGIERAHFVGHSSGGMCLLFIGIHHPERVRTLSLVSATYTFDKHAKAHMREVADSLEYNPEGIAQSQLLHGSVHGDDYWKVHREAFREFTRDPKELPFTPEDLKGIRRPVLVFHGDRDAFFPVSIPVTIYQSIPGSELCILPATAHGLPSEQPQLFLEILQDFLRRNADA